MISEPLRQFSDIHTHHKGDPSAVCSLQPSEAIELCRSDENQPFSIMLHPWHANVELDMQFLNAINFCKADPRFVAIGECGLDKNCDTPLDVQLHSFEIALRTAKEMHKPVILHVVKMWDPMFKVVNAIFGSQGAIKADTEGARLIVHGFRKNAQLARQLVDAGYYLSLGNKFNPDVISVINSNKIYHETDETAIFDDVFDTDSTQKQ